MNSKSSPSSFKSNSSRKRALNNNNGNSAISKKTAKSDSQVASVNLSSVKISSPLSRQSCLHQEAPTASSVTISDKSWMARRWSTLSGSLIVRQQKIRKKTKRSWKNRQKRRTFPPSQDILNKDLKKFTDPMFMRKTDKKNRQSLQEILTQFNQHSTQHTPSTTTSSSSISKRLGKLLKKKGKQPFRRKKKPPSLCIMSDETLVQNNLFFKPPPTISSKSSTPMSPVKFPTPPKRFSAYYVDLEGNLGKTDYSKPRPWKETLIKHFKKENYADYYEQQLILHLSLFLLGFLFFPCWWIGTVLYFVKKKKLILLKKREENQNLHYFIHEFDLISIHTFGYLNSIFTCLSILLIAIIIALLVLYNKTTM